MESSGSYRSGLLTAGGILSIIGGAFEVAGGAVALGLVVAHRELFGLAPPGTHAGFYFGYFGRFVPVDLISLIIVGAPILALGIVAIIGGVSAIRRKNFGLSLAGAICALPSVIFGLYLAGAISALASLILGILAVIFVALGKREFGVKA